MTYERLLKQKSDMWKASISKCVSFCHCLVIKESLLPYLTTGKHHMQYIVFFSCGCFVKELLQWCLSLLRGFYGVKDIKDGRNRIEACFLGLPANLEAKMS